MTTLSADLAQDRRRYRKLYARLWSDPDFVKLTQLEKLVAIYLLCGPQTNRVGLYRFSLATAKEDMGFDRKGRLAAKTAACIGSFKWEFDASASVLWIPSWWSYHTFGERENNFRGALTDLAEVPPTDLLPKFCNNLRDLHPRLHPLIQAWLPKPGRPHSVETQSTPQSRPSRGSVKAQSGLPDKTRPDKTRVQAAASENAAPSPVEISAPDLEPEPESSPQRRPTEPTFALLERMAHAVLDLAKPDDTATDLMAGFHDLLLDAKLERDQERMWRAIESARKQRQLYGRAG